MTERIAAANGTFDVIVPERTSAIPSADPSTVTLIADALPSSPSPMAVVQRAELAGELGAHMATLLGTAMVVLTDAVKIDASVVSDGINGDATAMFMVAYRQGLFGMTATTLMFDLRGDRFSVTTVATNEAAAFAHDLGLAVAGSVRPLVPSSP